MMYNLLVFRAARSSRNFRDHILAEGMPEVKAGFSCILVMLYYLNTLTIYVDLYTHIHSFISI